MGTFGSALVRRIAWPLVAGLLLALGACREPEPYPASQQAAALDRQIDWTGARLIVVQHGGRYKTLDSFARESFAAMTGKEHLPGLSPVASLFEWLFHREAYADTPLIRVREAGIRARLIAHMSEKDRQRIINDQCFTLAEISDPRIDQLLRAMESQPLTRRAAGRAHQARTIAMLLERMLRIVPQPDGDTVAEWFTPTEVMANLSDEQLRAMGLRRDDLPPEARAPAGAVAPQQALRITVDWTSLRAAWLRGDKSAVQSYLDRLSEFLPALAMSGVYPSVSQRAAEARYYAMGKFTAGWALYFLAFLVSMWALLTRWRTPWVASLILLAAALAWHVYGLSLRWYILGRIPVANMFEAVVAAAGMAIAVVLVLELIFRTRIFLVAASVTGFLGLLLAGYVLPGGELSTIPAILDHVQLRIHTVLIIASYAFIFLAAVIAVIYLLGYYAVTLRRPRVAAVRPASVGLIDPLAIGVSRHRPILAGAAPGDEARGGELPTWLNNIDWFHLILLNMAFVMLFVGGVVLGAIWANDAWGRPWGWDPKEVFALVTWLIYAILIHIRFVVRNRGLWTAWLSIAGCTVMAFNWFFVNFYINSVHSYA